jgi:hypothetical protein
MRRLTKLGDDGLVFTVVAEALGVADILLKDAADRENPSRSPVISDNISHELK